QLDWKSDFVSFSGNWLEQIERDIQMETLDDISKAMFEKRSDIMKRAAQALIERKYGHILEQEYCECLHCHKNIVTVHGHKFFPPVIGSGKFSWKCDRPIASLSMRNGKA
ncbi:MAG TPA: hypothetical protein VLM43_16975, partial [Desulfobacterales bacterium]|nr:hypothetical protein [Desulfobacterales bacterium]